MIKSLLKIAFLSVNLLILIFHQFSIIGLPFPHRCKTSCSLKGFLKVNNTNTKKYGKKALINSAISSWNDIQKYLSSNKMPCDVPTLKLKSLLNKHFQES